MRRTLMFLAIMLVLATSVSAQSGSREAALFRRFVAGIEREEIYFSYASLVQTNFDISFTVFINGEDAFTVTERTLTITDGYVIQTADQESRSGTVDIVYEYSDPEASGNFHVIADLVFTDETLYIDAEYMEDDSDTPPLEAGWQLYTSFEDIPEPIQALDLPVVFMLETSVYKAQELLSEVVDRIELEETELTNGTPVDEITLWVDEEALDTFFSVLIEDSDRDEELLRTLMEHDDFGGEIRMIARFNQDDDILETEVELLLTMDDIPLGLVDSEAPAGGTMNLVIEFSQYGLRDSINTEFAPIEPPTHE
jgi:hypothetical protein